ncbi:MAG: Cro/CI family transcriptional regulator [bacterium]
MNTPYDRVVEKFGTAYRLAKALGIDVPAVYRWGYNGGAIPQEHHKKIFEAAGMLGVEITPEDLSVLV